MPDAKELKWIVSDEKNVEQFRQATWNGVVMMITAEGPGTCKVFVSGGGENERKQGLSPCDAVEWALEQAEAIHKTYELRDQKDLLETISEVDKCIAD